MKKIYYPILVVVCLFLFAATFPQKEKWKGSIEKVNGVVVVKNPKKPIYASVDFQLIEEITIGEKIGEEKLMFSQIRDIAVDDDGKIYILDIKEAHIKVFDEAGQYLRTIGRRGQGPGEIGMPSYLSITSEDEILVEDPMNRRLTFFTLEGIHSKTISTAKVTIIKSKSDSHGNIVGVVMNIRKKAFEISKYSSEIEFICAYGSEPLPQNPINYNPFKTSMTWTMDSEDNIFSSVCSDYEINIYNPMGILIKKITREVDPLRITQNELEEAKKRVPEKRIFYAPNYHYPLARFILSDEGQILAQTWEKPEDSKGYIYDYFDKEGKYLFKTILNIQPRIWIKGKIYTIEEDEDGYQYVKRYKIKNWDQIKEGI